MVKKSIHFSAEDLEEQAELANLLGISGIYGAFPKTIKVGNTLANNYIKYMAEVIPTLKPAELDMLLSSIRKIKIRQYERKRRLELEKLAKK